MILTFLATRVPKKWSLQITHANVGRDHSVRKKSPLASGLLFAKTAPQPPSCKVGPAKARRPKGKPNQRNIALGGRGGGLFGGGFFFARARSWAKNKCKLLWADLFAKVWCHHCPREGQPPTCPQRTKRPPNIRGLFFRTTRYQRKLRLPQPQRTHRAYAPHTQQKWANNSGEKSVGTSDNPWEPVGAVVGTPVGTSANL